MAERDRAEDAIQGPASGAAGRPPPAGVVLRDRTEADLPSLAEVLVAQREGTRYPWMWPLPVPIDDFIVRGGEERAWVAEVDGRPVGHVAVAHVTDHGDGIAGGWMAATGRGPDELGEVGVLFVDEDLRGRGIGSALVDEAVAWVRASGRLPVLDVVQHHGDAARLYRRKGWQEVGEVRPAWLLTEADPPLLLMVLPPEAGAPEPPAGRPDGRDGP
jgi:GNAT superfamily N-acetyltransferase